jgi:hypothetical protein
MGRFRIGSLLGDLTNLHVLGFAEKADEIYTFLVGAPCYYGLAELYAPFGPVSLR